MKAAKSEQISRDLNRSTRTNRVNFAAATTSGRYPSARIRSLTPSECNADNVNASVQHPRQNLPGNSSRVSRPAAEHHDLTPRVTSNENTSDNNMNEMNHSIEKDIERSMIALSRNYQPTQQFADTSEEWKDEERAEVPSSSASTTSSFLQAAAIPPRLVTQETTPGAVCVPGLVGSFDDQHDNLLDMEDENDVYNINNDSSGISSRFSSNGRQESTSFTLHSQSASLSTPIVAELVPSHSLSEREVEDRLAERLEAQITERLQQEVDRRLSIEKRQHAVAEVISSGDESIDDENTKLGKKEEENFKICGVRRTWWGMVICVIMLLTIAGIGSTYLWYSRGREIITNSTDNTPSQSPSADTPTISPTLSVPSTLNVNATSMPTPPPQESTEPTTTSPTLSSIDQRWEYLMTSVVPHVIPEEFVGIPATYFTNNAFQRAALDWMATEDLETDVFDFPVPLLVERYVLAVLYYSTGGLEIWTESLSFLSSKNVCQWNNDHDIQNTIVGNAGTFEGNPGISGVPVEYTVVKKGVFCEDGSLFVTSIEIPDNSLQGKVPWELSLLEYVSQLNFDSNNFQGSIPAKLGRLSRLKALWFKSNDLTGSLPPELSNATELASIDIEANNITSVLPFEWGSLSNLFYVSLRQNDITGSLPSDWRKLNRLKTLDLEGNQLRGTIPEGFGELTELVSLYLESNQLEGLLPSSLGNLMNLVNFFVDDNRFSGTVPTEYSALVNLEYFWFNQNSFTGSVDLTLCDSFLRPIGTSFKSNCLSNELTGVEAQIQCSCCTVCCDSSGTNCEDNPLP